MRKLTAFLLAFAMTAMTLPALAVDTGGVDIESGLVAYYNFDADGNEPTIIADASGNGNDARVLNNEQTVDFGFGQIKQFTKKLTVENGAAYFPGYEKASRGRRSATVLGAAVKLPESIKGELRDYTVSMWVKPDTSYDNYSGGYERLFDFGISTTDSIFLRYNMVGGLRFQDRGITNSGSDANSYEEATVGNITGKWSLFTVSYSAAGAGLTVYLDGNPIIESTGKFTRSIGEIGGISDDTYGMFLGRTQWYKEQTDDNPDYKGYMDEVRIYNRALSADEVAMLYSVSNPEGEKVPYAVEPPEEVVTAAGTAPALPKTVTVKYLGGVTGTESVEWEDIAPEKYASDASFTVKGKLTGFDLYTEVAVRVVSDPSESIKAGMLAYYNFEEDPAEPSVIKDMSGNGYNAAVLNNVRSGGWEGSVNNKLLIDDGKAVFPGYTKTVNENFGFSMTNDGAAIQLPASINQGVEDYTLSMWVKADSGYEFAKKAQRLFDLGNRSGNGNDAYTNSIFAAYTADTDGAVFKSIIEVKDRYIQKGTNDGVADAVFNDKWGLLTVSYDKSESTVKVYINGEQILSSSSMTRSIGDLGTLDADSNGLYIGRNQWHTNWEEKDNNPDFKGQMDEIRLYSRALSDAEVKTLYNKTNPERKITVTINLTYLDENLATINKRQETVEVAENSSFAPNPDDYSTVSGSGPLVFSEALSKDTMSIEKVTDENCTINLYYAIMKAVSAENQAVETYQGIAPTLPEQVEITYKTGDKAVADVTWEPVSPESYVDIGTFTVNGTAEGIPVTATVTVFGISSVEVNENVYTSWGTAPRLPENARVTLSNRPEETVYEPVEWDTITDEQIAEGKSFTVSGRLKNFPEITVSTRVNFIVEAAVEVGAAADTYTSTENSGNRNYGSETEFKITSTGGSGPAGYDRYAFLRFPKSELENVLGASLKIFVKYIDNNRTTTYTLHALDKNYSGWDEKTLTWNNQTEFVDNAVEIATATLSASTKDQWLEFDISDYVLSNPDLEYYNFYISCNTCATYVTSRENGENSPAIAYMTDGQTVTVSYVCGDELLAKETVIAPKYTKFTYTEGKKALVTDGKAYSYKSGENVIENVDENNCTITFEMAETTNVVFDDIVVSTYYDEAAVMPSEVGASVDGYKITLPARFETSPYEDLGVYEVYGSAEGMTVKAVVKAYGRYVNSNGFLLGYASRIWHEYVDGGEAAAEPVAVMVQTGTDYAPGDMVKYYPQLAGGVAADDTVYVTEPEHTVVISGKKVGGVSGYASASLSGDDPSSYTVNVSAVAANTDETASSARIIIVKYDKDGKVADFKTVNANLDAAMSGRREFSAEVGYSRSENEDIRIYLWDFGRLKPLGTTILVSQLEIPPKYSDEIMALIPDYDQVVENVQRANNYWQNTYSYNQSGGTKYPSFWDGSAYHTGNMEMYFTFNDEKDKEYSINWADYNEWMGNTNQGDKSKWTSGYTEDRSGTGALFGDWQICFQTYLDLNLLDPEERKAARAKEVMGYEITKSNDNFWWWADSLYMVTPVMTKMYLTTGDEDYLDAMYRYYLYAAELMYDGEDGIPNEGEEYKSTAKLNSGAAYSDPDNYANLFFRDANYVYPLKPNSGHENEKNFWARGNGWVFAGLAKVLNDLPTDYEHYGFFLKIYKEMAKAVIDCQQLDLEGRGFWTQSMLQDYPKGNNGNDEGYETSGTAFLTYGLFWGLNSGILDENTYLEPALRAWKYLSEEALHDDGRVGYVQYIGSNATDAISYNTTQNFGVGAFLLAGSEASRWVDGVTENNMPYLQRKLWHAVAFKDGKYFENGTVSEGTPAIERGGKTYVPIDEFTKRLGVDYEIGTSGAVIYDKLNSKRGSLNDEDVIEENGTVYASVTEMARAVGRYAVVYGNVTVVSHKNTVFYGCDEKSVEYLNSLLN